MRSLLLGCLLAAIAAQEPFLPGTRTLRDGRLVVEVMDPDAPERYNRGVRFATVAAVLRASLDGRQFLHAPAHHDPVEDHGGLASEFDLCIPGGPPAHLPPGWREAGQGGGFLKIGVGVLEKRGDSYHLFHQPRLLQAAATRVDWGPSGAVFRQVCSGTDGWAYELDAEVTLRDPEIAVVWRLRNTGTRAFATRSYAHNFMAFDGREVGPGYELRFPVPVEVRGLLGQQAPLADGVSFGARIPTWINLEVAVNAGPLPRSCELSHRAAGMSCTIATTVPVDAVAVHARAAYVSPEQFVRLELEPGREAVWGRSWRLSLR